MTDTPRLEYTLTGSPRDIADDLALAERINRDVIDRALQALDEQRKPQWLR